MGEELIHNRGRGPEIVGTRITVYNLLPYFLDSSMSEAYIAKVHDLTTEQVAAARAYVLNNPDTVLATHMQIEARIAAGNPPEVAEQAKRTHERFMQFKEWIERRKQTGKQVEERTPVSLREKANTPFPSFQEWLNMSDSAEHS